MGNLLFVGCFFVIFEVVVFCRIFCKKVFFFSDFLFIDIVVGDIAGVGVGVGVGAFFEAVGFDRKNILVYNNYDFIWMSEVCYFLE